MSIDPDRHLLYAIGQGSTQAAAELYGRHAQGLLHYLAHLTGDAQTAEDLVQELLIVVWRDARRFRGQSSVRTWLFSIAHHLGVTALRRKRTLPLDESTAEGLAGPGPDPADAAALAVDRERLARALQALSPAQRAVIELVFYHDLAQAEVAQVLGCPVGTVKSRLHYALGALNRIMREQDEQLS